MNDEIMYELKEEVTKMLMGKCDVEGTQLMVLSRSEERAHEARRQLVMNTCNIDDAIDAIKYLRISVQLLTLYLTLVVEPGEDYRDKQSRIRDLNDFNKTLSIIRNELLIFIPVLLLAIKGNYDRVPGVFTELTYYVELLTDRLTLSPLIREYESDSVHDVFDDLTRFIELLNNDFIELLSIMHGKNRVPELVEKHKNSMAGRAE